MRQKEDGEKMEGRLEFGTGLRARLERAQMLARAQRNGSLGQVIVPTPLTLVEAPALAIVHDDPAHADGDDAFALLLDLSRTVDGRENLDLEHSRAIAVLSRNLARVLDLDEDAVRRAYLGGMFHDLGKIELPETILRKPGPLDTEEWTQMASHAERGADLVDRIGGMRDVAAIVASHHERWDGVGYPFKLAGESIPVEARIVAASDAFVTMTSDRPFRGAMPAAGALMELIRAAGSGFDPDVVSALLALTFEHAASDARNGHELGAVA